MQACAIERATSEDRIVAERFRRRAKRCCMNWREQPGRAALDIVIYLSDAAAP